jgi:hypothetical protein
MLADGVDLCGFADTATWSSAAIARLIATYASGAVATPARGPDRRVLSGVRYGGLSGQRLGAR